MTMLGYLFRIAALLALLLIPVPIKAQTIADLVRDGDDFVTLEGLLNLTGLISLFERAELNYTVFAPTDGAFNASDSSLVEKLQDPEWVRHAGCVLAYHVVNTIVRSANMTEGQELQTLDDDLGVLTINLDPIRVNGIAVATPDVEATNGLVHGIAEGILTPKCVTEGITDYLKSQTDYGFFSAFLDASNLTSAIDIASPVTLFSPFNTAFENLETEVQNRLQSDPEFMQVVLLSHLFGGNLYSELLTTDFTVLVDDVLGKTAFFGNFTDKGLTINGVPMSNTTDKLRENGVIHAVDEVVLPLFVDTLIERLNNLTNGEISLDIFYNSLVASNFTESLGMSEKFNDTVPFTIFAPSDQAMALLTQASLERLVDPVWYYHNRQLWRQHIVVGFEASLDNLANASFIEVSTTENLTITVDSEEHVIIDGNTVIDEYYSDLFAVNGAIHTIDRVLIPRIYQLSIVDVGEANDDFSILVSLVRKARLDNTLDGSGPLTVFAPTNEAFAAANITVDTPVDDSITRLLLHHIVEGNQYFSDLQDNETLTTMLGSTVTFTVGADDNQEPIYRIDGSELLDVALPNNGIVYVLGQLLEPPEATPEPTMIGSESPSAVPTSSPMPTSVLVPPSAVAPPTSGSGIALMGISAFMLPALGMILSI